VDGGLETSALICFRYPINLILDTLFDLDGCLVGEFLFGGLEGIQLGVFRSVTVPSIPRSYLLQSECCFPY